MIQSILYFLPAVLYSLDLFTLIRHWHTKTDFLDFLICIFLKVHSSLIRLLDICLSQCISTSTIYILFTVSISAAVCIWHECTSTTPQTHLEILSPLFKLRLHLYLYCCWFLLSERKDWRNLLLFFLSDLNWIECAATKEKTPNPKYLKTYFVIMYAFGLLKIPQTIFLLISIARTSSHPYQKTPKNQEIERERQICV